MKLTQAELIQVLRRRANLNQGDFGASAFDTSYESGRTKVKNIELGKQKPTAEDLRKMARVLGVPENEMHPANDAASGMVKLDPGDLVLKSGVLALFAGLDTYLDMLDKAVRIGDGELIQHICEKSAEIFSGYAKNYPQAAQQEAKG